MATVSTKSSLAIMGGKPAVNLEAPAWPVVGDWEAKTMDKVVRSGKWSWLGAHERAFCSEFSRFVGSKYAIGMANGTVTLQCGLQAVGVVPGDEVIVPGLTWVATAQAAMDIGANVVFADIDPETLAIDPASVEKAITKRTKAIIVVHLYGCMCDMDAIMKIARKHKLKVIEDVAHQHGSRWRGKGAGAIGDVGSFSFQQSKVLTSGEGGAVTCNDPEVYRTAFALKQVGWAPGDMKKSIFDNLVEGGHYGHNYRITEMQCVLLRGGLRHMGRDLAKREDSALFIAEQLKKMGGPLRAVRRDPRVTLQSYYAMTLFLDPEKLGGATRDQYVRALAAENVPIGATYAPVYRNRLLNLYDRTSPIPFRDRKKVQDYRRLKLPNTERAVYETALLFGQIHLLSSRARLSQFLTGVRKVNDNLAAVRKCAIPQARK